MSPNRTIRPVKSILIKSCGKKTGHKEKRSLRLDKEKNSLRLDPCGISVSCLAKNLKVEKSCWINQREKEKEYS